MTNDAAKPRSKRWMIVVAVVAVVGIVGVGAAGLLLKKDAKGYIAEADAAQKKGDLQAQIIHLKNAVQREPNNGQARYKLALASLDAGDAVSAEKEIKIAAERGISPDLVAPVLAAAYFNQAKYQLVLDIPEGNRPSAAEAEVRSWRGSAFLALRDVVRAEQSFQAALAASPQHLQAEVGLAQVEILRRNFAGAEAMLDAVVAKKPDTKVVIDAQMLKGQLRRQGQDLDGAIAAYSAVLKASPSNLRARIERAQVYIQKNLGASAQPDVKYILARSPSHPIAVHLQAWIHLQNKDENAAYDLLQRQGTNLTRYAPNLLMMGRLQLNRNQGEAAQTSLSQYLQANPNHMEVRLFLANLLIRKDLPDQAISILKSTPREMANDSRVLRMMASASMRAGRVNEAGLWLDRATQAASDTQTRAQIAVERVALGQTDTAIKELDQAIELDPKSSDARVLMIVTQLRSGNQEEAERQAKALQAEMPTSPIPDNLLGGISLTRGDRAAARMHYENALKKKSDYVASIINLAKLDRFENKADDAVKRYTQAVGIEPNADSMVALAELAQIRNDRDGAQEWLVKAVALDGQAIMPRLAMVNLLLVQGERDKAKAAADDLLKVAPEHPDSVDAMARVQMASGNPGAAADGYRSLISAGQSAPLIYARYAQALVAKGDVAEAKNVLRNGVTANPDVPDLAAELASLLLRTGDRDEALKVARDWQSKHKDHVAGDLLVAETLLQQGKFSDALVPSEAAFKKAPSARTVATLARAQRGAGDSDAAVNSLRQWLQSNPEDHASRGVLASLHIDLRQYDGAIKESETLLQSQPTNPIVLNNLAWLYQNHRKDPRALEFAEKAHAAAPNAPAIMDTLGFILAQKGDYDRSLALLQRAYDISQRQPDIGYHLAFVLSKTGKTSEARDLLKAVLGNPRPFDEKADAEKLLKSLGN